MEFLHLTYLAASPATVGGLLQQLPILLPALLGVAAPFITELLTKYDAPRWCKSLTNFALTCLAGVVPTVVFDPAGGWKAYVLAILAAWVVSMATHATGVTYPLQQATKDLGTAAGARRDTPIGTGPHAVDAGNQPEV